MLVQAPVARATNGACIAALVCGIIGLCANLLVVPALVALVLGIVGRRQARDRDQGGDGMGLAGIILGALGLAFGALYWWFMVMVLGI